MSLDQFIRLADSIVEFEADLNNNQYPVSSLNALEVHRYELKSNWSQVKVAFEQYIRDIEKEDDADNPIDIESFKLKYKSTYTTYCNCLVRLSEMSDSIRQSLNPSSEATVPQTSNSIRPSSSHFIESESKNLHLPPIDIEAFQGDYASWPTFRDIFTAVVSNSRASNVEKLFFLTQKTKGEAREIVRKSPLTNQGFDIAWKNLCFRFDNRRVLVNGQLKILFNLQTVNSESGKSLKLLQRDINSCIANLKIHNIDVASWDPIFVFLCTNKLPETTLTLWEHQLRDKTSIPKWSELDEFLTNRYRTLESVSEIRSTNGHKSTDLKRGSNSNTSIKQKVHSFQVNVNSPVCQLCPKENHIIRKCPKFLKMSYKSRLDEIKKEGLCLNCFSKTHSVRNCTSKHSCFKCQKRHNTLLHKEIDIPIDNTQISTTNVNSSLNPNSAPYIRPNKNNIQSTSTTSSGQIQSCFATNSKGVLLGTAWVNICHLGLEYKVRALIDSGSEGTLISQRIFNLLKLPSESTNAQISGLNNSVSAKVQHECSLILGSPLNSDISIPVTALVVPHLSNSLPSCTIPKDQFDTLPDIPLADPKFYSSSKIDILLGGDIFPSIICPGIRHNICKSLIAQETIFGWILTGPIRSNLSTRSTIVSYFCEISLDKEISRFWEVENLPRTNLLSSSDKFCEDLYLRTTKRNSNGRFIVSLPFKEEFPNTLKIGQSRTNAMAQFFRNEARLMRNRELKSEYDNVIQEYEDLGHMSRVGSYNESDYQRTFYLPHHAVLKPDSVTTKVRVVFNASAPSSNGQSLNSLLHTGPILQNDLTILILKWRFFKFVINADIQKMYRQILVHPDHTPFQRILFRSDPHTPITDYELNTVTFGVNCAPYLAIRTLLKLADDVEAIYPLASSILRNSMYVDDVLAGFHTGEESIKAKEQLIQALKSAGFSLRKWTSNSKDILDGIPPDHLLHEDFLKLEETSSAKTLGIRWNACFDNFYFVAHPLDETVNYTKREVLSQIAKLFDPAGWLAPCIITAKILMQRIWTDGTGWDEIISSEALIQWKNFQSNYSSINSIRIPRWIRYCPQSKLQFHGFCDASEKAYAAALYVRVENVSSISTFLISSKTKVAPIKTISIPRLELCGAVLLSEMLDTLIPRLNVEKYSIFCWTDSTIVLSWLAKPPFCWQTFVANRVSKITQIINYSQWNHVSSGSNPADLASRGVTPQELLDNELWWYGPKWLEKPESQWPYVEYSTVLKNIPEAKSIQVHFSYFKNFDDPLERFSSFHRAMRVMAYVYRFFHRTHPRYRSTFSKATTILSTCEIVDVQTKFVIIYQKAWYPNEYKALSDGQYISKCSIILSLNPFLDPEGIIRSCGRCETSSIDSIPHSSRDSNPILSPTERSTTKSHSHHKEPIPSTTKTTSLTSIIRQNSVILLPTVLVKVGSSTAHARCLLDSGSAYSRVSKKLVDQLDLTGYTLKEETICPLIIKSRFDSTSKIEGTFRVDNRIALRTPSQSLPESYKKHFRDLFLADSKFYESASIDIVIGVDLYPKVICPGVFSRIGFPTAQSTIFGWVIYGTCTL
ncbi:uncharacterized protein ACRADG_002324 [Cochliomyia hominivorax]